MSTKLTQPICACGAFQTLQTFFKRGGKQVYFHACNHCGKQTNYYPTAAEADAEWADLVEFAEIPRTPCPNLPCDGCQFCDHALIKVGNHGNP